jgi:CRISPR-associated exonuclease Cas4
MTRFTRRPFLWHTPNLMDGLVWLVILALLWLAWRAWRGRRRAAAWLDRRGLSPDSVTLAQDLVPDPRWAGPQTLADPQLRLRGTVDHLLRAADGRLVVAEHKAVQRLPEAPHESHRLQVAAYLLLCERDPRVGEAPAYGLLTYRDPRGSARAFRVDRTPELLARVADTVAALRTHDGAPTIRRSHAQPGRCRGCGWRTICDERLS